MRQAAPADTAAASFCTHFHLAGTPLVTDPGPLRGGSTFPHALDALFTETHRRGL
ncbi:hypothetical protein [Mycobacterium haemophilum]|uniref:hypothetical protein n=1 Tax=Mycobacterium haemophilum TaxID=29311 RepID=UPI000A4D24CE|nr:hypothetical protein [Mycobacterium haemophilum]